MEREPRRMTFIVVPHGGRDLNTRSFEVSYRRLRGAGVVLLVMAIAWIGMAVSWGYVLSQAARVPGLQQEVARLEGERAQVEQLASMLRQLEGQYTQVREMLGATRAGEPGSIWLPAISEAGSVAPSPADSASGVPSVWPLTERGFVTREHLGRIPGQHPGIDIAVAEGTYVRASAAGQVTEAGADEVYGNYVRLMHLDGYETVYGHASELFVSPDDEVRRGQVIALSGNTGTSTAPHLHFEVWKDGEPIDPRALIEAP